MALYGNLVDSKLGECMTPDNQIHLVNDLARTRFQSNAGFALVRATFALWRQLFFGRSGNL